VELIGCAVNEGRGDGIEGYNGVRGYLQDVKGFVVVDFAFEWPVLISMPELQRL
jgi:hypothetical protein